MKEMLKGKGKEEEEKIPYVVLQTEEYCVILTQSLCTHGVCTLCTGLKIELKMDSLKRKKSSPFSSRSGCCTHIF